MRRSVAALALALAGCTPGIAREDVPADPIAFVRSEAKFGIASASDFLSSITYGDDEHRDEQEQRRTKTSVVLLTVPTGEMRTVPDSSGNALPLDWTRDGTRLLLGRPQPRVRNNALVLWNRLTGAFDRVNPPESSGGAALADGPILASAVAWLAEPDGKPGPSTIVVYTPDNGLAPLPGSLGGYDPDVSPDGRTVVFTRRARKGGPATMVLSGLQDGSARVIGRGETPRFSRDGRWIAYALPQSGQSDIWVMRSDGSHKRAVTSSSFDEVTPAPSPDGRYVVYSSVRASLRGAQAGALSEPGENRKAEESHLYLARVEDGYEIQLTQNSQNGRPVW